VIVRVRDIRAERGAQSDSRKSAERNGRR
jgi:hypothetical protein